MMVDAVMFAKLNQKVVLMAEEQEAHRQKRAELARSVEELRRSFNGLKEAIEGIACRLPTSVTPLCSVESDGPSNTTGGGTLIPDLARFGTTTMKGVTVVSKHPAHDEISRTGLVERKEVSDLNAYQLLDELHKSENASEDEHNELSRDDDEQIVAKKVTLENLSDSTMEDDDQMILAKEMVQSKWEGEAKVAREPTKFVAHQVFDEVLEPQQGLKQSMVKVFEVNSMHNAPSLHNATFLLLVNSEFLKKHGLLNGLCASMGYMTVVCFDPGGLSMPPVIHQLNQKRLFRESSGLWCIEDELSEMSLCGKEFLLFHKIVNHENKNSTMAGHSVSAEVVEINGESHLFGSLSLELNMDMCEYRNPKCDYMGVFAFDLEEKLLSSTELFMDELQLVKAISLNFDEHEEQVVTISLMEEKCSLQDFVVAYLKADEFSEFCGGSIDYLGAVCFCHRREKRLTKFSPGFMFGHLWRRMIEVSFITSTEISVRYPLFSRHENIRTPINDFCNEVLPEPLVDNIKLYDPGGGKHFSIFASTKANMCYYLHIYKGAATLSVTSYICIQLTVLPQATEIKLRQEHGRLAFKVVRLMASLQGYFKVSFQLWSNENHFIEMDYNLAYVLLNLYKNGADLFHLVPKENLFFYMGYYGERGKMCCYIGFYESVLISPTRILLLGFHFASLNWVNRYCLLYISNSGKEDLREGLLVEYLYCTSALLKLQVHLQVFINECILKFSSMEQNFFDP